MKNRDKTKPSAEWLSGVHNRKGTETNGSELNIVFCRAEQMIDGGDAVLSLKGSIFRIENERLNNGRSSKKGLR